MHTRQCPQEDAVPALKARSRCGIVYDWSEARSDARDSHSHGGGALGVLLGGAR